MVAAMTDAWVVVLVVGAGTILLKAAGPLLLGGRPLPVRIRSVVALLAPALLAALVATATFGEDRALVVDARIVGVATGAIALALRAPVLAVVLVAAAATALARLIGGT
jgi:branched-subunit amino acid transport protein